MHSRRRPLALLLVLLLGGAIAFGAWHYERDAARVEDRLVLHGNVDIRQVELAFNASGRIDRVLASEGARVTQGQLLAVLDTERLRRRVTQAEAQVATQRQILARLEAGSRPEEIRKAQAEVQAVQTAARSDTHIRSCLFNDFFRAHGAAELTPVFCALDSIWVDELHKPRYGVRFARPTTLAAGDDACRFQFSKVAGPDSNA